MDRQLQMALKNLAITLRTYVASRGEPDREAEMLVRSCEQLYRALGAELAPLERTCRFETKGAGR